MYRLWVLWSCIFVLLLIIMGSIPFSPFEKWWFIVNFMSNVSIIRAFLSVLILFLVAYILLVGAFHQRYSLRLEQLSFGGINILLNKSDLLFKKSVKNYLDTKRTLFKFDPNYDSIEEVLNSYYECYKFIRDEMNLLDVKKKRDKKLYLLSNEILKTLNSFLTKHQNNYRRWHKYVSDHDKVTTKDRDPNGEFISLPYHLTPISIIQKHYYHFSQVLEGFKEVNDFFNDKVVKEFDINVDKWSE
ncbi:hypothetical protein [Escherichia coli]|uniref:hypothetical protein n=1 Tax=Escherichia coli TaxID=562 RepID=UPI00259CA306|nr:hypothetical protein [Escherichia coli]WJL61775.1 hypothetical protein QQA26_02260 [Escherichia coli O78:H4]